MFSRYLAFVALVASGCYSSPLHNSTRLTEDSHNIYQCPDPTAIADSPLCQLRIQENGHFFSTISKTVDCPQSGINKEKIACIIVKDNVENDNGGYSSITTGGLDQYFVEIHLKSQWGKGIDFSIEVYTALQTTTAAAGTTAAGGTTAAASTTTG